MLHPRVRHFDQLVAVFVPGIRPEPVLEALEHGPGLGKLTPRRLHVIVERPEVEREGTALTLERVAEVRVMAGADGDGVIVDRVHHEPFVCGGAVRVVGRPPQPAVRDIDQTVRHRERDALAVRLVGLRVLVGPPHAGAEPLVGGHDPGAAQAVAGPGEAAVPGRSPGGLRLPVIENRDRLNGPCVCGASSWAKKALPSRLNATARPSCTMLSTSSGIMRSICISLEGWSTRYEMPFDPRMLESVGLMATRKS